MGGGMPPPPPPPPPPAPPNSQMTPELKASLIQLLIATGRIEDIPEVELHPENFRKEIAEIQHQDTTLAPVPQPPQATPPAAMPDPSGSMGQMDPSQPGGGGNQPMQPMSRRAADNMAPRCPNCGSGTTGIRDGNEGEGEPGAHCHSCGLDWRPKTKESAILVALLSPAAEKPPKDPNIPANSSLTWQDDQGQQLIANNVYDLHAPSHAAPDRVMVLYAHPDELGLKLVGQFANISGSGDDTEPDFRVTPEQVQSKHYTFTLADNKDSTDSTANPPLGGMPGLDPDSPERPNHCSNQPEQPDPARPPPGTTPTSVTSAAATVSIT